ncbi:ATP-binding protein [Pseudobacter ginsenosidimutans]|uniref:AAA+ ATPase domain-containing protein n=1 Tax=Pseudobacter ginsenosidimutans TaxID=661488 RepID=A0A4Q7MRF7_9BACT|nr:ATP-binding protein [Pseudobacter ginsenosidimutans]QEC45703.1 ATP-binding protein [Pseudobacter ginsenosidimutans]RZS69359.1 hypothetical protein EV199_5196 [Pseudobacter ginsenosidimutans]
MTTIPRQITSELQAALKVSPVVFLDGPRQSGKSTLVRHITHPPVVDAEESATYITFDSPTQMAAAAAEPQAFLTSRKGNLIIDEVQLVPEIFRALKIVVDEIRLKDKSNVNGRFLLTGSANILALPQLSDPLVGRTSVLTLYPFCTAEAIQSKCDGLTRLLSMNFDAMSSHGLSLIKAIELATFPEISTSNSGERFRWFDGYLSTILQRDVRQLAELDKIALLPTLLRVLATRAGNLLNDADIARDIGLNAVTSKNYRNILKMMFLNFDVQPWYRNIGKRLVKAPKGYLTDTMLLSHMLGMELEDMQLNRPELFGHVLENYVATELVKQLSFGNVRGQLHHFRTSDGKEVDFVIEKQDGSIFAIEIKKSESVSIHDFKGIQLLAESAPKDFKGGVILYSGKEAVPFGKNLWAVPFQVLWQ